MIPEITIKISFGGEGGQSPSVVTKPADAIEIAPPARPADAVADVFIPPPPMLEDALRASHQGEAIPTPLPVERAADVYIPPPPTLEDALRASHEAEAIPPPPSVERAADVTDLPPPPE
jgi:hypothetical protein